jgi:hypothetical protein
MLFAVVLPVFGLKGVTVVIAARRAFGIRFARNALPGDGRKDARLLFGLENRQNSRAYELVLRLDKLQRRFP